MKALATILDFDELTDVFTHGNFPRIGMPANALRICRRAAILLLLGGQIAFAQGPWFKSFTPRREFFVSPRGIDTHLLLDYSGHTNHGTRVNGPGRVAGLVLSPSGESMALNLDGSDDNVQLSSGVCPWGADCTIEVWIKTGSATTFPGPYRLVNFPILSSWEGQSAAGVGQAFGIQGGRINFAVSEDATCSDAYADIQGSSVNDGRWHHVAATVDQAGRVGQIFICSAFWTNCVFTVGY